MFENFTTPLLIGWRGGQSPGGLKVKKIQNDNPRMKIRPNKWTFPGKKKSFLYPFLEHGKRSFTVRKVHARKSKICIKYIQETWKFFFLTHIQLCALAYFDPKKCI